MGEAFGTMDFGCGACEARGFDGISLHVPDSWQYLEAVYQWKFNGRDGKRLARKGRTDYWEAVIHFCKAQEFASIYRDGKIRASWTGFSHVPAVCLTEAPAGNWDELQDRHGTFGYVFRKREVIAGGGGPALYVSEKLIHAQEHEGGFCTEIKPFLNLLRIPSVTPGKKKYDFLQEREWRLPCDLLFRKIEPYAVIVGRYDTATEGWKDIWHARIAFEELREPPDPGSAR